jgi:hypothetical protein
VTERSARRGRRALAPLAALALAAALAGAPSASAAATHNCAVPKYPGSGYFELLSVVGVSCAKGKSVMRAHYRCRVKHGVKGRCTSKVQGYACTESRQSISTEIDAVVKCRSGTRRVTYAYQQNT